VSGIALLQQEVVMGTEYWHFAHGTPFPAQINTGVCCGHAGGMEFLPGGFLPTGYTYYYRSTYGVDGSKKTFGSALAVRNPNHCHT
jgi:hypothetical protein